MSMTVPRLLVWLPRRSALRQIIHAKPPHIYTHSQHVSGCNTTPARHVAKLLFTRADCDMEYELVETFINGAAHNTRGRVAAWEAHNLVEELVDVSADSASYTLQLNAELVLNQTSHHVSNIYPMWPTPVTKLFGPHIN